jgi:hypothetical protein
MTGSGVSSEEVFGSVLGKQIRFYQRVAGIAELFLIPMRREGERRENRRTLRTYKGLDPFTPLPTYPQVDTTSYSHYPTSLPETTAPTTTEHRPAQRSSARTRVKVRHG